MTRRLERWATYMAACGLAIVTVAVAVLLGPNLESSLYPVLDDVRVVDARRDVAGWSLYTLEADKQRACVFQSLSFIAGRTSGTGLAVRVEPDTGAPGLSRPVGAQQFRWRIDTRGLSAGEVRGVAIHECHGLWSTQSPLGPWAIPGQPAQP